MNVCAVCEFRFKVTPRTFDCVAMGSAVLFILMSRLILQGVHFSFKANSPVG